MTTARRSPYSDGCVVARFIPKFRVAEDGCWLWIGAKTQDGYGLFYFGDGRGGAAHRWAYEAWVGPLEEGKQIDHLCRTRACVNPTHLEQVTPLENHRRSMRPDTSTHCKHGHERTEDNTWINPKTGFRVCRVCDRAGQRRRYKKRVAKKAAKGTRR